MKFSRSVFQCFSEPANQQVSGSVDQQHRQTDKPKHRILKRGFTLVELLLAMGILTILMTLIMRVFLQMIETRLDAEAESAVAQDGRYIYSRLAYDINRANEIVIPANPGDSGSQLVLTVEGQTYTYEIDGSSNFTFNDGVETVNLTSAGSLSTGASFTHLGGIEGAQSVTLDVQLESVTQRNRGPASFRIESTIGTR